MTFALNDEVIVHGGPQGLGDRHDVLRQTNVRGGRCRIARGVIMDEDDRRRGEFEGAAHDFTRINRRVIDRAATLHLIGDRAIALVEEKNAEFLALGQRYGGAAIIENIAERGKLLAATQRAAYEPSRRRLDDFKFGDGCFAEPIDFA